MLMRPLYETCLCHWSIMILYVCCFQARMYQCEKCSKSYNRHSLLVRHSHVHDELRPFMCSVCQKTFVCKDSLNQHKLTHTDVTTADVPFVAKLSNRGVVCTNTRASTNQQNTHATLDRREYLLAHFNLTLSARIYHLCLSLFSNCINISNLNSDSN